MIEKTTRFTNVPNDVLSIIKRTLQELQSKKLNPAEARAVDLALTNLSYHPLIPANDFFLSFQSEEYYYSLAYCSYKIELSDSYSFDTGAGMEHDQRFSFIYSTDGDSESKGNLDEFEITFFHALAELKKEEISISGEE